MKAGGDTILVERRVGKSNGKPDPQTENRVQRQRVSEVRGVQNPADKNPDAHAGNNRECPPGLVVLVKPVCRQPPPAVSRGQVNQYGGQRNEEIEHF